MVGLWALEMPSGMPYLDAEEKHKKAIAEAKAILPNLSPESRSKVEELIKALEAATAHFGQDYTPDEHEIRTYNIRQHVDAVLLNLPESLWSLFSDVPNNYVSVVDYRKDLIEWADAIHGAWHQPEDMGTWGQVPHYWDDPTWPDDRDDIVGRLAVDPQVELPILRRLIAAYVDGRTHPGEHFNFETEAWEPGVADPSALQTSKALIYGPKIDEYIGWMQIDDFVATSPEY